MDRSMSVIAIHMGPRFMRLAPVLRRAHVGKTLLEGTAAVHRGNTLARVICNAFGLPQDNKEVHLRVECNHFKDSMIWNRDFDGFEMKSNFTARGDMLEEKFGPLVMSFKADAKDGALVYEYCDAKLLGFSLPKFLHPTIHASERELNGKYHFSVKVSIPIVGEIIHYSGDLNVSHI